MAKQTPIERYQQAVAAAEDRCRQEITPDLKRYDQEIAAASERYGREITTTRSQVTR